jgi:hypothetical protein
MKIHAGENTATPAVNVMLGGFLKKTVLILKRF